MTKRVKITLLIFGLIGVTLLLTHNYINRKICNAIEVKIKSQTGGEYDIKINSISLNPFSSNCKINNIELNSTNIKADIGNITIIGIGLRKFISNHDIELKNIIIKSPKIDFIPITRKTIKKSNANNKPKKLEALKLEHITIKDGSFNLYKTTFKDNPYLAVKHFNIKTDSISIPLNDQLTFIHNTQELSLKDIKYKMHLSTLNVGSIDLLENKDLALNSLSIEPIYSKESFGTKTGLKDWLQVKIKKCTFIGIDYKSLLNKHINISNIDIKGVDLEDYKNLKIKSQPMRKRLLYQQLHHANIPIKIKKISFKDFNLTYEEMPLVGNNPGLLTIKDLSGDITNINSTGPTDSYFTLAAKGDIMGKAPLSIKWDMPNHSINNNFIVEGKLENADLDIFNPITIPLAHIQLKEGGKIDELKFTVTGDSLNSKARMNMHYHNLHVNFVKDKVLKDNPDTVKNRHILSFLANEAAIHRSNPHNNKDRVGAGVAHRDVYKSQFNYLWISLLPAIKSSILTTTIPLKKDEREEVKSVKQEEKQHKKEERLHKKEEKKVAKNN